MSRKDWVWITLVIAVIHGVVTMLIMPAAFDVISSRFDGNDYESPWDPYLVGLYFFLNIPYFALNYIAPPMGFFPQAYYLTWVGNSLIWGLLGAWLVSRLPFMKKRPDTTE